MNETAGSQIRRPSRRTLIVAALISATLLLVSGIAVWRHMGGAGGDPMAERTAVIAKIDAAVEAAGTHHTGCAAGFAALVASNAEQSLNADLDPLETCGKTARTLADAGYGALDAGTGLSSSPLRAAYLDAAGSLLSIYEMQGDDFDVVFDLMHRARVTGTPIASLASDVSYILGNGAPDLAAAREELDRARTAYRRRG